MESGDGDNDRCGEWILSQDHAIISILTTLSSTRALGSEKYAVIIFLYSGTRNQASYTMRIVRLVSALLWSLHTAATILQNGQVREDPYPGQAPRIELDDSWRTYDADTEEISYKGRWDSNHVSCM